MEARDNREMTDIEVARLWERLSALKELLDTRLVAQAEALELQAREYARRLDDLNNAHERADKALLASVSRELCDMRSGQLDARIKEIEIIQANQSGKASQLSFLIATGIAILGLALGVAAILTK